MGPDDVNFADFNGDGLPDLVVSNYTTGTVNLVLANLGGGYKCLAHSKWEIIRILPLLATSTSMAHRILWFPIASATTPERC